MSDARVYDLAGRDVTDCLYCCWFQARAWDAIENAPDVKCVCEDDS